MVGLRRPTHEAHGGKETVRSSASRRLELPSPRFRHPRPRCRGESPLIVNLAQVFMRTSCDNFYRGSDVLGVITRNPPFRSNVIGKTYFCCWVKASRYLFIYAVPFGLGALLTESPPNRPTQVDIGPRKFTTCSPSSLVRPNIR